MKAAVVFFAVSGVVGVFFVRNNVLFVCLSLQYYRIERPLVLVVRPFDFGML